MQKQMMESYTSVCSGANRRGNLSGSTSGVKRNRQATDDDRISGEKKPRLDDTSMSDNNTKGILNEWGQRNEKEVRYESISEDGPDHRKQFTVSVLINGKPYGKGCGNRKRDAEQKAAEMALTRLRINIGSTRGNSSSSSQPMPDSKSQLNELLQERQYRHEYHDISRRGPDHKPTFTVGLSINGKRAAKGSGRSKIDAERSAAMVVLRKINSGQIDLNEYPAPDPTDDNRGLAADAKSKLNDWVQSRRKEIEYKQVMTRGPDHELRFEVSLSIGGLLMTSGNGTSLQRAELDAAEKAIQKISNERSQNYPRANSPRYHLSAYDELAMITHKTFEAVTHNVIVTIDKESVVAAIIMENILTDSKTVLSLGSGNVFVDEESLSGDGQSVIDSHAEIIARRGFQRVIYKEIESLLPKSVSKNGILRRDDNRTISVAEGIRFHLYISKAPCGDGGIFTLSQQEPSKDTGTIHKPVQSDKKQGLLRAKIARGEGAIPVADLPTDRLHKMSCSDKICKWNVLGLQGALLSKIINLPLHLSSIVLGDVYDFNHLSRALCCRVRSQVPNVSSNLSVNHPDIGFSNKYEEPELGKSKPTSVNWNIVDGSVEVTNGRTGKISSDSYLQKQTVTKNEPSRLCKSEIFKLFRRLQYQDSEVLYRRQTRGNSNYGIAKLSSIEYQNKKKELYQHFQRKGFGAWKRRTDMDSFKWI